MRAFWSYGVALVIIAVIAVWMGSGLIVEGGKGPGNGERSVVSLVESDGGPLTDAVKQFAPEHVAEAASEDPALTIAERNAQAGEGVDAAPRSVRVQVITAQAMPIEVPLRGRTKSNSVLKVPAETAGIVDAVEVTKGQKVLPGDLLCTLNQGTRNGSVAQASASVKQAEAGLAQAQLNFDTNAALRGKGLAAANTEEGVRTALAAAQAGLEAAQTGLSNAQAELERTFIRAKIGGIVQEPIAEVGSMLSVGSVCATIVESDPMLFLASVPEAKMGYAKLGLSAKVTTVTGQIIDGKVTYIDTTANPDTRSFPVEIELDNSNGTILDGVTADAIVNVGVAPVHVLPQSVLTLDDEGVLGIRTVEDGSKVAFHPVNIIKDTRDGVWVVGLPYKINVITLGQEYVQSGQVVDARTADGEKI